MHATSWVQSCLETLLATPPLPWMLNEILTGGPLVLVLAKSLIAPEVKLGWIPGEVPVMLL
jgi:hypothetical protein